MHPERIVCLVEWAQRTQQHLKVFRILPVTQITICRAQKCPDNR